LARTTQNPHPDDDALATLADDESLEDDVRRHVDGCADCGGRVEELRQMRRLLHSQAAKQQHAQHDVARRAVSRLRLRQTAIGNMNEVFASLRALVRGIADLFGGGPPVGPGPSTLPDEGHRHG